MLITKPQVKLCMTAGWPAVSSLDKYYDSDSISQGCSEARNVKDALLRTGSWGLGTCLQKPGTPMQNLGEEGNQKSEVRTEQPGTV